MAKIILSKDFIKGACKLALNEDLYPSGDISSNLLKKNIVKKVKLISNQGGIIGGLEFLKQTYKLIDKSIKNDLKKKRRFQSQKRRNYRYYKWQYKKYTNWGKSCIKFLIPHIRNCYHNKSIC